MTVRCKFVCTETGQVRSHNTENPVLHSAKFSAVYGDSPENKEFFMYTPAAELSLGIVKKQHFEVGKEYYLDITEA